MVLDNIFASGRGPKWWNSRRQCSLEKINAQDLDNNTDAMEMQQHHDLFDNEAPKSAQHAEHEGVFGDEAGHDIQYMKLGWKLTSCLMIAEVVSNGILSLPSSAAQVGIMPAAFLTVFLGVFSAFTGYLLCNFKLNHPDVHNMGDAGYILGGVVGRELLFWGSILIAILAQGSHLLAGKFALAALSDHKICALKYTAIFAGAAIIGSAPRKLSHISWLCALSSFSIALSAIVGMAASGLHHISGRTVSLQIDTNFNDAFVAITNPVFAYAGHFVFFTLMSEMRNPRDAIKSVYVLSAFTISFYTMFTIVCYAYLGNDVASPVFESLPTVWKKAAYGCGIGSFLISSCLSAHIAAKQIFVRYLRGSRHLHSNTFTGWGVWAFLIIAIGIIGFVLATGIPIFNSIIGLIASLFASWFTYGIAGFFLLHDMATIDNDGYSRWQVYMGKPTKFVIGVMCVLSGAFICVAGTFVTIKRIVDDYNNGTISEPFAC